MIRLAFLLGIALSLTLSACQKPVEQTPLVRPVRVITLAPHAIDRSSEYSGEVRPRTEARLGFRVPGKMISRQVDVGATVKQGQVLARLDPQDLQLAQAAAKAQLVAAETERNLAAADLKRYADLRSKGFISSAELDRRESTLQAAQARVEQAQAQVNQQGNQTSYASLVADADGVVTGVDAEPGQVLAAGQSVVRIAHQGGKEVVFTIPENRIGSLAVGSVAEVRTWARPERLLRGRIREIAPLADPATRTFSARLALEQAPADVLLGMTATIRFAGTAAAQGLTLPSTALVEKDGKSAVWLFDPATSTVNLAAVTTGVGNGNDIVITSGLAPGQMVVTAGVHQLQPGQKVVKLAEGAIGSRQ